MRKNKIEEIIRELQATGQGTRLTAMDKARVCAHLTEERELSTFQAADLLGKSEQFVRDYKKLYHADPMLQEASQDRDKGGLGAAWAIGVARCTKGDRPRQRQLVERARTSPKERRKVLEELKLVGRLP